MKKVIKIGSFVLLGIVILVVWLAYGYFQAMKKSASEDPLVWEEAIVDFEQAELVSESVLFVGSSSIRLWDSLAKDMASFTVINRGFGGSKINDVVYYADRLFAVPDPLAIVIFVGTNDIVPDNAKTPEVVFASYQEMIRRVRAAHPVVPIYYIAITPSPSRWSVWPVAQEANRLIDEYNAKDDLLATLDTAPLLLDSGEPDPELYVFDGLHLSEKGYARWTSMIHPRLLADLLSAESPAVQ